MKLEIEIPTSLDDITLEQYQEFMTIKEPTNEQLLSIFLKMPLENVMRIKDSSFDILVEKLNELFLEKQKHKLQFKLNGVSFGFIPKIDSITYGENKDVSTYIGDWKNMHRAMAVLYRPIIQKQNDRYLIEEYKGTMEYAEFMKKMPLSIVMGSIVFFYDLTNDLLKVIPNYLEKEIAKEQTKGQISVKSGEVIKKYIHSLKEMSDDLMKLQSYHYINV